MSFRVAANNWSGGSFLIRFPVRADFLTKIASLLVIVLLAQPLIAQTGIGAPGIVVRGAVFFAGRQGRWTLLTAWTILFGTLENYNLAQSCARKAVQISENGHDDAR